MTVEWITLGVITGGAAILFWALKGWVSGINLRFDNLIKEMRDLGKSIVAHDGRIQLLHERQDTHENRINNHSERLREIELKQAKIESRNGKKEV